MAMGVKVYRLVFHRCADDAMVFAREKFLFLWRMIVSWLDESQAMLLLYLSKM
jgi:hypothetical protein